MRLNEPEFRDELKRLLSRNVPEFDVSRIDVREMVDTAGEDGIAVKVILRTRPAQWDAFRTWRVTDQFRSWLAHRDDERFPYFTYLTEEEERELAKPDA